MELSFTTLTNCGGKRQEKKKIEEKTEKEREKEEGEMCILQIRSVSKLYVLKQIKRYFNKPNIGTYDVKSCSDKATFYSQT